MNIRKCAGCCVGAGAFTVMQLTVLRGSQQRTLSVELSQRPKSMPW